VQLLNCLLLLVAGAEALAHLLAPLVVLVVHIGIQLLPAHLLEHTP
jgi:hypothetical protein